MKLRLEQPPKEYTDDKAVVLIDTDSCDEPILLGCPDALKRAKEIMHAVNFYSPMFRVLEQLGKTEPSHVSQLRRLRDTTLVILKGIELAQERNNE